MKNKVEQASIDDLRNGFAFDSKTKMLTCLFCSSEFEEGDVFSFGNRLVSAEKAMKMHIAEKHGYIFDVLLSLDKSQTGLTNTQKDFLENYYSGISDKDIAEKMGISTSTVRFQRYNFREKVKQARIILALNELLEEKKDLNAPVSQEKEGTEKLDAFFSSVSPLILKDFNVKEKNKIFILETILKQFEISKSYTEKEVNEILMPIYDDYASIRRSLIDYGLMTRAYVGNEYMVK
ncbi:MAG: DUF2087 domain-containing protein [Clostridiales bacterium]|jgi:hypothetical protein|nr:DUF2087 domain-containing protein [Clostridiales bacterium]